MNKLTDQTKKQIDQIWNYHQLPRYAGEADLIIGLGSYSIKVAEQAASLYLDGKAPKILFTGGFGNWTKDTFLKTESETFKSTAVSMGVPEENIYCETKATNTGKNIIFSRQLIKNIGLNPDTVLFISKPNMMRRCYATCKQQWPEITSYFTSPKINIEDQIEKHHDLESVINEIVGDILRISEYPKLGYQINQEIPNDIWDAFNALVAQGYDKHLPNTD